MLDVLIAPRLSFFFFFFFFFWTSSRGSSSMGGRLRQTLRRPFVCELLSFFRWENFFQGLLGLILVYLTYSTIWKKVLEYPNLYKYLLKKKKKSFQNILDLKDDMTRSFLFGLQPIWEGGRPWITTAQKPSMVFDFSPDWDVCNCHQYILWKNH